jgi:RNA polymerase sigma-70 factor (ECF subfamily)
VENIVASRTARATEGDDERTAAFLGLADRQLERSYGLACVILGNPADAQDAVQDAFIAAWRNWRTLRDPARMEPWFHRIVVNTCRNRLKQSSRWRVHDISDELAVEARDAIGPTHDRDALDRALAELRSDDQIILALRYYRDLKVDDIAMQLGLRPGTVISRLHHALRRLRASLEAKGGEETLR